MTGRGSKSDWESVNPCISIRRHVLLEKKYKESILSIQRFFSVFWFKKYYTESTCIHKKYNRILRVNLSSNLFNFVSIFCIKVLYFFAEMLLYLLANFHSMRRIYQVNGDSRLSKSSSSSNPM